MGRMMQLMLGTQLGTAFGNAFSNKLFAPTSNPTPTTQPGYTNPPPPPPQQPSNPTDTGTGTGSSSIDDLLNLLHGGNGTNTPGQVTPPSTTEIPAFVNPTAGAVPLHVVAQFKSGAPCNDAWDLMWGDGAHDAMIHTLPSGNATCSSAIQTNTVPHTYTATGTYTVTLKTGINLTSGSSTIVTVRATSTSDVPSPTVSGTSSISTSSPSASVFASLLSRLADELAGLSSAILDFFARIFSGSGTNSDNATSTPVVDAQDVIVGTSTLAEPGDLVTILYTAHTQDGTALPLFETTDDHPYTFYLGGNDTIQGLEIGVQGMRAGGERLLSIPPDLGFGDVAVTNASGTVIVPAHSTIIMEVHLLTVESTTTSN
jgi:hypothetical protein